MDKLFWGFFLLVLEFHLSFGHSALHLLPDWLGYAFLITGCSQLEGESELFKKPQPFCIVLCIYSALLWLGDFLGLGQSTSVFSMLLHVVAVCLRLYILWMVINAITNMEMRRNYDLASAHLRKLWVVMAVFTVAACLLLWVPAMASIASLAAAIVCIIFLFAFRSTRKLYRKMLDEYAQSF